MKEMIKNISMRRAFIICVLLTVALALITSAFTIWGCLSFRQWLLPKTDEVYLSVNAEYADGSTVTSELLLQVGQELPMLGMDTENGANGPTEVSYTLARAEQSYHALTKKRQVAYIGAGALMIVMPMLYLAAGILLCAFWFYKNKIEKPLNVLLDATGHIAGRNLDFTVEYTADDEMGQLCKAFEDMRAALYRTNRELWATVEERQNLQASIAHDLRNPIAIIKGYTEYLQLNLPKGKMEQKQILMIADNLAFSAERLERYTESLRYINRLEGLEIKPSACQLPQFLTAVAEDMRMLAEKNGLAIRVCSDVPNAEVMLDEESYCRVLENIVQNSLRFARTEVLLSWRYENTMLITTVTDDGAGFPLEILNKRKHSILSFDSSGEHIGMGLVVSEMLCRKHGGELKLENTADGAAVCFSFCTK